MLCDACLLGENNLGAQEMGESPSVPGLFLCRACDRTFDESKGYAFRSRSKESQNLIRSACLHQLPMYIESVTPSTYRYRCPKPDCDHRGPEEPMPHVW